VPVSPSWPCKPPGPQHTPPGRGGELAARHSGLWRGFLEAYVAVPFSPLTRSVTDLAALAAWLWPLYTQPLEAGRVRSEARCRGSGGGLLLAMKR
jgi:hypothetical protein